MQISKLVLPVSILLGCVILGGFYYASVVAQQASTERQQQATLQAQQAAAQADLQAKKDQQQADLQATQAQQQAITDQNNLIASEKAACVELAAKTAISVYEDSYLCRGNNAPQNCTDGQTYLMGNYNNEYDTCLQSKGLK